LAVALARAVLNGADAVLALRVLEGGPFAHSRATELAALVLSSQPVEPGVREREGSEK
jgi:hypothetical protein